MIYGIFRTGNGRAYATRAMALLAACAVSAADEFGDDVDLNAEFDAILEEFGQELEIPAWEFSGEVETGAGYRDNVLLSALNPEGSSFVQATANAFAWRLPDRGWEWTNFVDATITHYFENDFDDAILVMARSEVSWDSGESLSFDFAGQYFYQDEVIDASNLESGLGATRARLHHFGLDQRSHWDFARNWRTSLRLKVGTYDFKPPLDDFDEYVSEWELSRDLEKFGDVSMNVGYMIRDYPDRPQANGSGNSIPGTLLQVDQTWLGLAHELRGGAEWKWKSTVRGSYMENRDNGSGWYDYNRGVASVAFSVDHGRWLLDSDISWRRYDYLLQRVGFGNPPLRQREEWAWFVRLEREISESWVVFAEAQLERSDSTDPFLIYDVNTAMTGFRWMR